jgi:carboxylesterase type B
MYYGTLTICLSTGFVLSSYAESLDTPLPTVTIDAGEIVGTTTSLSTAATLVNQFLGIPFAASPPERFAPPEKPTQWPQPLDTKERKPACVQQFNCKPSYLRSSHGLQLTFIDPEANRDFVQQIFNHEAPEESEDCLYLNVFAPASPPAGKGRAVLYWIYGGGLQFGYAGLEDYDDSFFAAFEDVIIVTVNYRTNGASSYSPNYLFIVQLLTKLQSSAFQTPPSSP